MATTYVPNPIDTSAVQLSDEMLDLVELLARNTHEVWAQLRMVEGWHYRPSSAEDHTDHPSLVPYEELPESEKQFDRDIVIQVLKVIVSLGYRLTKP